MVFEQKSKNTATTKHKNPCQSLDSNPGPLAMQSDA